MTSPGSPPLDAKIVVGAFLASGTVHLVRPETFEPLMPEAVPAHREVIYASGVAELVCAAGLLHPRTRRLAGLASAALLRRGLPRQHQDGRRRAEDEATGRSRPSRLARLPAAAPDDPRRAEGRLARADVSRR